MKSNQYTRTKLIVKLKQYFDISNDTDLANRLGTTNQKRNSWKTKIANWRKNPEPLSDTETLNLVKDIRDASIHKEVIKTIVEYYPIEKVESKGKTKYEISPPGKLKQEWIDLRKKLENTKAGIYIFYDSSSRAIYVGKTAGKGKTSSLWLRMKSSFNHYQNSRQQYRIDHSKGNIVNVRKLGLRPVRLHELAKYFSAYEIHPKLTHNIEALLIRAFADNLMNKRMENFNN